MEEEEEVLRGMGGWEEGRQTDGRTELGLGNLLSPVQPGSVYYHLLARVHLVPSITTKIVEIAVLGFNPQAAAAEIRRWE